MPTRVQLPNGQIGDFPDGMTPQQIEAVLSKQFPKPAPTAPPPSMASRALSTLEDVGIGAAKGAGNTLNNIGSFLFPDSVAKSVGMTPPTEQQKESYFAPTNTAQKVGRTGEQIAEWFTPIGLEEKAGAMVAEHAPTMAKYLAPVARMGEQAIESGLRNKAQGGSFATGAKMGAVSSGIGQAGEALAPIWARNALRIPKKIDSREVNTGKTIMNLPGAPIRPAKIAEAAEKRIGELGQQLDTAVSRPGLPTVDQRPVMAPINDALANTNNPDNVRDLDKLGKMIREDKNTGLKPLDISPKDALTNRRDIDDMITSWDMQPRPDRVTGATQQAYGAQTGGLHAAVPETVPIDRELSNTIPVRYYANRAANLKGVTENLMVPKGSSLTTAGAGLGYGTSHTPEGAFLGAVSGRVIPELLMNPTVRMGMARGINSPLMPATLRGVGLNLPDLEKKKQDQP